MAAQSGAGGGNGSKDRSETRRRRARWCIGVVVLAGAGWCRLVPAIEGTLGGRVGSGAGRRPATGRDTVLDVVEKV